MSQHTYQVVQVSYEIGPTTVKVIPSALSVPPNAGSVHAFSCRIRHFRGRSHHIHTCVYIYKVIHTTYLAVLTTWQTTYDIGSTTLKVIPKFFKTVLTTLNVVPSVLTGLDIVQYRSRRFISDTFVNFDTMSCHIRDTATYGT